MSLSLTGTLSGFTAAIQNTVNTAATGTLIMQEQNSGGTVTCLSTDGGTVSTNSSTSTTINKFGGSTTMVPGTPVATTISVKDVGTAPASTFTLTPGASCTQGTNGSSNGTATDLCAKMTLTITQSGTSIFNGTLATFVSGGAISLGTAAVNTSIPFVFTVTLPSASGNTYQGLSASVPMTWTFNS